MPSRVYAVLLEEPSSESFERLRKTYADNFYEMTPTSGFVRTDALTRTIAEKAGIKDEQEQIASGVVFRLNKAYSGFADRALWEWLRQAEED